MLLPSARSLGGCNLMENNSCPFTNVEKARTGITTFECVASVTEAQFPRHGRSRKQNKRKVRSSSAITIVGIAEEEIFEKRFELEQKGTDLLSDFLDDVYLPWSKVNKKSWRDDVYMVPMLKAHFEGKALRDISVQLVERFKTNRMNTPTKKGTARQPATVNRELNLLSSAFSLAVLYDKAEFNPCSKSIFSRSIIFATDICYPKKNRASWQNSAGLALT